MNKPRDPIVYRSYIDNRGEILIQQYNHIPAFAEDFIQCYIHFNFACNIM